MVKVDLITGFLGSGKTTFIHRYIEYFSRHGQKVHVIENEFGSVSLDRQLLADDDCGVSDLAGVCMCCTGKRIFSDMLIQCAEEGIDRILVEPSGIYDVDEFFSVMMTDCVSECCEIGSILTIVDTRLGAELSDEARYLMFSQLLAAGRVIMSKTQMFDQEKVRQTVGQLNELMRQFGSDRVFGDDVCTKPWEELSDEDFLEFQQSGYRILEHTRENLQHNLIFESREMADFCENEEDLKARLERLMTDESFGTVLRIKGHIQDLKGNWYEINCSRDGMSVRPCQIRRGIYVIIGQKLQDEALQTAFISRRMIRNRQKSSC